MKPCTFDFEKLLDAYEGRSARADRERVLQHITNGCKSCSQGWAWIERSLSAASSLAGPQPPDWCTARATLLFRDRYAQPARPTLFARLLLDSRRPATAALARSARDASHYVVYTTELYDVELWQEAVGKDSAYVIGQVLCKNGGAVEVRSARLTGEGGQAFQADGRADEFHLPAVAPGVYELQLSLADQEIWVPDLRITR